MDKDPKGGSAQHYVTRKGKEGEFTWNNLTIVGVKYRDGGEYKCSATNPVGELNLHSFRFLILKLELGSETLFLYTSYKIIANI